MQSNSLLLVFQWVVVTRVLASKLITEVFNTQVKSLEVNQPVCEPQ